MHLTYGLKPVPFDGLKPVPFDGLKPVPFDGLKPVPFDGLKPVPFDLTQYRLFWLDAGKTAEAGRRFTG